MSVDMSKKLEEKTPPKGLGTCRVSTVKSARQTETSEYCLDDIRGWIVEGKGDFAKKIKMIRATSDEEKQVELKLTLPGVMFSGTFHRRSSKELIQHSGLICMDFDDVEHPAETIDNMRFDPHLALAFVSPRANGVKAVFCIPDDGNHGNAFETVRDYCATMYELQADEACKDVSRLCFLSVDPEAHYAPDALPLRVAPKVEAPKPKKKPTEGDRIGDRYQASSDIWNRSADLLTGVGWKIGRSGGDRIFCTRPGKERGVSGTLWSDGGFYCFSDQAPPLKPSQGYSAFALYSTLEHGGNFKEAAKALADEFGDEYKNKSGTDFYGKATSASEAKVDVTNKEKLSLFEQLQTRKFDPNNLTEPLEPILELKNTPIISSGNLLVLKAHDKSGKSHVMAAMAKAITQGGRHLGITSRVNGRVAYIDCEQDREDFERLMLRQGGGDQDKLAAYNITGYGPKESREATQAILEGEEEIIALLIDGYADLCLDLNDASDANDLVAWLMALAEKHRVAIIGVLHLNPGSQEKSRGHLGSQLDRKSQTSLQISTENDGTRCIYTSKARKRPVPKSNAVRFEWSDDAGAFVEINGTPGEIKLAQKAEDLTRTLRDVEANTGMMAWKFKELKEEIEQVESIKDRAARNRILAMLSANLLKHNSKVGTYTSNLPKAPDKNEHKASID
jgi:hypothetical protein